MNSVVISGLEKINKLHPRTAAVMIMQMVENGYHAAVINSVEIEQVDERNCEVVVRMTGQKTNRPNTTHNIRFECGHANNWACASYNIHSTYTINN